MNVPSWPQKRKRKMKLAIMATKRLGYLVIIFSLTSCNSDVLLDEEPSTIASPVAIGFDNGYVENAACTRAATYKLNDYAQTMGVWGWEKDDKETESPIFDNHNIEYNGTVWEYTPLRYWKEGCTYQFYAYAPHTSNQKGNKAVVTLNETTGMMSITGVTLNGDNLHEAKTATEQMKSFITAPNDVDWMVARTGQTAQGTAHNIVEFTMQHVLAKLNVRIRKTESLSTDADIKEIRVNSLSIGTMAADGSFTQKHKATQDATTSEEEWTTGNTTMTLNGTKDFSVTTQWQYMLESLVIPQAMPNAEVMLVYSIVFTDGRKEYFTYCTPLKEVFSTVSHLVSGNSYTISFTIEPDVIKFDSGTNIWTDII